MGFSHRMPWAAGIRVEQLRSQSPSVREGVKTASHTFCLASAGPVYIA